MEFEAKMRPFLEDLGVEDMFDNSKANLKDIADDPLYGLVHLLFKKLISLSNVKSK